jgi:hypothetical protein
MTISVIGHPHLSKTGSPEVDPIATGQLNEHKNDPRAHSDIFATKQDIIGSPNDIPGLVTVINQLTREAGTLEGRPSADSVAEGYEYFGISDQAGAWYKVVGGVWIQTTPFVTIP